MKLPVLWIAAKADPNAETSDLVPKEFPLDQVIHQAAKNESPLFDSREACEIYIQEGTNAQM